MNEAANEWEKIDSKKRIIFVRDGLMWSTFGHNAESVGNALGIPVTEKDGLKSVSFVDGMIQFYIVDIVKKGFRVIKINHSLL